LVRFQLSKSEFTVALEKFGDRDARGLFDALVEIDEVPAELASETSAYCTFARAHKTG
jgi:hypothetical protein